MRLDRDGGNGTACGTTELRKKGFRIETRHGRNYGERVKKIWAAESHLVKGFLRSANETDGNPAFADEARTQVSILVDFDNRKDIFTSQEGMRRLSPTR
jgi:hypothetical protein